MAVEAVACFSCGDEFHPNYRKETCKTCKNVLHRNCAYLIPDLKDEKFCKSCFWIEVLKTVNGVHVQCCPVAAKCDVLMREMRAQFTGDFEYDKDSLFFGSPVDIYGIYEQNNPHRYRTKRLLKKLGLLNTASAIRTKRLTAA